MCERKKWYLARYGHIVNGTVNNEVILWTVDITIYRDTCFFTQLSANLQYL